MLELDLSQASEGRVLVDGLVLQWIVHTQVRPYRLVGFSQTAIRERGVFLTTSQVDEGPTFAPAEFMAEVVLTPTATGLQCRARVRHPEGVRVLKTVIDGLPSGSIRTTAGDGQRTTAAGQPAREYPSTWPTPMLWLEPDVVRRRFVARTVSEAMSRKAFSVRLRPSGETELTLYEEAPSTSFGPHFSGTTWTLALVPSVMGELSRHGDELGQAWRLKPAERRDDSGQWLKQCDLVVRLSGVDHTGLVHLDFDGMAGAVAALGRYGDLGHTLFHVVGWDGPFMRHCPSLRPADELGGADGLRALVAAIHKTGARLILGTNPVAASQAEAECHGLDAFQCQGFMGGKIDYPARDWDGDGFSETGWLLLNLWFKDYRDWLVGRCEELLTAYGVDGFFLGGTDLYANDRRGDPLEGWRLLIRELRDLREDVVLVGEGQVDYVACLTPVFEPHGRVDSAEFQLTVGRWGRSIAYSATTGSQHRAGVGEPVHADYRPLKGIGRNVLPAVSIGRGTVETNLEYLITGLKWARRWHDMYATASEPSPVGADVPDAQ